MPDITIKPTMRMVLMTSMGTIVVSRLSRPSCDNNESVSVVLISFIVLSINLLRFGRNASCILSGIC